MAIDAEQKLVFSGSAEGEMKAWRLDHEAMSGGLQENEDGEVRLSSASLWIMFSCDVIRLRK